MNTSSHESILDSLPCGLCVVDGDGRILSTNPALEQLLGWHSAEWRGQPLSLYLEQTILDPAQVPRWTQALNLALALSRTTQLTLPTRFRVGPDDAAPVSITGIVTPWQEDNTAQSGALVIFHDSAAWTTAFDLLSPSDATSRASRSQ